MRAAHARQRDGGRDAMAATCCAVGPVANHLQTGAARPQTVKATLQRHQAITGSQQIRSNHTHAHASVVKKGPSTSLPQTRQPQSERQPMAVTICGKVLPPEALRALSLRGGGKRGRSTNGRRRITPAISQKALARADDDAASSVALAFDESVCPALDLSGAVEERAQGVHPAYLRHARALDLRYHPQ